MTKTPRSSAKTDADKDNAKPGVKANLDYTPPKEGGTTKERDDRAVRAAERIDPPDVPAIPGGVEENTVTSESEGANPPVRGAHEGAYDPEANVEAPPEPSKKAALRKYVVTGGSPIFPLGNTNKAKKEHGADRARAYQSGEVVELTKEQAKYYVGLKRLDPYIDDDED